LSLQQIHSATAPIKLDTNNFSLNIQNPFEVTSAGNLGIKLATANIDLNPTSEEINKIYVNVDGELDYNAGELLKGGKGIKAESYLSQLGDLASPFNGINPLPDLTYLSADIDTEQLEFKNNKISIRSQGFSNMPFYDGFGLTVANEDVFTYSKLNNRLNVGSIILDTDVTNQSPLKSAVNKTYVDNLNLFKTLGALRTVQSNELQNPNTRYWEVLVDDITIKIDQENNCLKTTLITKEGSCLSIDPDQNLDININARLEVVDNTLKLKWDNYIYRGKLYY
jgi:hypothetical protein